MVCCTTQHLRCAVDLRYFWWQNGDASNAVFHDEVLDKARVPQATKDAIRDDPGSILRSPLGNQYWLTQDTVVHVGAVSALAQDALDSVSAS